MNIIALASLISFIVFILLAQFIYNESKNNPLNRIFAVFCVFLSLWSFSEYMYRHMPNASEAHVWIKISALFWTVPSAMSVHFVLFFSNKQKFLRKKLNLLFIYMPAVIFSFIDLTTNLITSNQPVRELGGYTYRAQEGSLLYWMSTIWAIGMAILALTMCIQYSFRTHDRQKKEQAKYISIGLSIPIIGAVLVSFVLPLFNIDFPEITVSLATILGLFVGYAIWKYQLFTVDPAMAADNIISTISDSLILLDKDEKIAFMNEAAERMLEYHDYELQGKDVTVIFEDKFFTKKLLSARRKNYETDFIKKSGKSFPASFSSSAITTKNEVKGIVILASDITEHKEVEVRIRKQQQFTDDLLQGLSEGFSVVDMEGKEILVNNALCEMTGFSRNELLNAKRPFKYWSEEGLRDIQDAFEKTLRGIEGDYELIFKKKNGEKLVALVSPRKAKDPDGNHVFFATIKDITRRKLSEEAIKNSEERLKILFEFAPDAYYLNDMKGTFIDCNKAAEEITGYKKKELIGQNFFKLKLLSQDEIIKATKLLLKNIKNKPTGPDEFTLNRKDGSRVVAEIRTYPVKIKDQSVVLGIARDVTERKRVEKALEKSEKKYRILAEAAHDAIFIIDKDGYFRYVNAFTANQLGNKPDKIINKPMSDFFPPEVVQKRMEGFSELFIKGEPFYTEEMTPISGKTIWTGTWLVPIKDRDGKFNEILGVARDITDRNKMEEALKESEQKLAKISDSAYDAIVMVNDEEQIIYWNKAAELIFGYSSEEAIGSKVHSLIMPEKYREVAGKGFQNFKITGQGRAIDSRLELSGLRKDGSEFPVELSLSSVKIKGKWNAIGLIRDITERKKAEEEIRHIAYYDSLTGLPNRKLFGDRFSQTLANAQRDKHMFAVMFLDLDGFKNINDNYGHGVGDALLKKVGKRFVNSIRQIDTVARMGGDEFAIILSRMNRVEDAAGVAGKIVELFSESFKLNGYNLTSTASIGISIFPTDGKNMAVLLSHADIAMYRAKETGKNKYQFYSETSQQKAA